MNQHIRKGAIAPGPVGTGLFLKGRSDKWPLSVHADSTGDGGEVVDVVRERIHGSTRRKRDEGMYARHPLHSKRPTP